MTKKKVDLKKAKSTETKESADSIKTDAFASASPSIVQSDAKSPVELKKAVSTPADVKKDETKVPTEELKE